MAYRYMLGIQEKGRAYRKAPVVCKNDTELKKVCDALLRPSTKVTILHKGKVR